MGINFSMSSSASSLLHILSNIFVNSSQLHIELLVEWQALPGKVQLRQARGKRQPKLYILDDKQLHSALAFIIIIETILSFHVVITMMSTTFFTMILWEPFENYLADFFR